MSKVLRFEGAGWDKAESNGVGNCRIRTTFVNEMGHTIYLEMGGHKRPERCIEAQKDFTFPWHIWHCFDVKDRDTHRTCGLSHYERLIREYTTKNILDFVNKKLHGGFDSIEIANDGSWDGFEVDGKSTTDQAGSL